MYNLGENNFYELPIQKKWNLSSFLALMKIVVSTIETLASFWHVFMFLAPVEPD